ncbi:hypothetical protein RHECNPAF_7500108 [Rhizobium etli CNPAF512]|nr:hypothetical protein RHECNPAF_7500108 [Rhizobium etli CNPAF512]
MMGWWTGVDGEAEADVFRPVAAW